MVQRLYTALFFCFALTLQTQAQTVWNGPTITFTKANGADFTQAANQDRITPSTWITRGNFQGIFNIAPGAETSYSHNFSPSNTRWATGTLANYANLNLKDTTWEEWAGGSTKIHTIIGKQAVLHLINENIYIGIKFLSFDNGHNVPSGGFSYERTTAPALPVTLINFTATKMKNNISLSWKTANEENTSSFTVERSADGKQFDAIGTIAAAGNSNSEKQYSFTDAAPLSSNFYRLRTENKDRSFTYSAIIAYKLTKASTLQFFPNPVVTTLHLQYNTTAQTTARIVDAMGRVVKSITLPAGDNALNVDVSSLKAGVYMLKTDSESKMFIKE